MRTLSLALCFFLTGPLQAQITRLPTSADALAASWLDCQAQNPSDHPYIRYLWVRDGDPETAKAGSLCCNIISRADAIQRPVGMGKDKLLVLRIDLRWYAPEDDEIADWLRFWEDLQFDPAFSMIITRGNLKFATASLPDVRVRSIVRKSEQVLVDTPPYIEAGTGLRQTRKWVWKHSAVENDVALVDLKDVDVIRLPDPMLDQKILGELVSMTGSLAPVVSDGYFAFRVLATIQTSIKDKDKAQKSGVYAQIYGGRYYQFAGIRKAKKGTDEDALLQDLGVAIDVDRGINAARLLDRLKSDQRAAVERSGVTGRPRRVDLFRTGTGRVDLVTGLISITHDIADDDIDVDVHPLANLVDFKDAAREVIWERKNGLHGYALFNGQGALQDEVPADVAKDHTIPAPNTARLQSAISCIACHEAEGSDGWKKVTNDVKKLKTKLEVFGDLSSGILFDFRTNARLASLYGGEPEKAFARGRDDYSAMVFRAVGDKGMKAANKGQTDIVKHAATKLVELSRGYYLDMLTPEKALAELGLKADKDAAKVLDALLRPEPVGPIVFEDFRIGLMRAGVSISRPDFDLVRPFAAQRVAMNLAKIAKEKK